MHRLELSRLEPRLLITVQWEVAETPEENVWSRWSHEGAHPELSVEEAWIIDAWHEWVQLDLRWDFGLVSQHFYLRDVYAALELHDELLRVYAESLALPAG